MNKLNKKPVTFKLTEIIIISLLVILTLKTCSLSTSNVNKRVDALSTKVDSLPTKTDLKIEGLKMEDRCIQSSYRKIYDLERQNKIKEEIKTLEK
jgi:hypothetical protein